MVVKKVKVTVYECTRCEHQWIPRNALADEQLLPTICPKCKSPYWNRPRQRNTGQKARKGRKR